MTLSNKEILKELRRTSKSLDRIEDAVVRELTTFVVGAVSQAAVTASTGSSIGLAKAVSDAMNPQFNEFKKSLNAASKDFRKLSAESMAGSLLSTLAFDAVVPDVFPNDVRLGLRFKNRTISQLVDVLRRGKMKRARLIIQDGILNRESRRSMVSSLLSMTSEIQANAEALVRTSINASTSQGVIDLMNANPELSRYRWISTLDNRVTEICRSRDHKEYAKDGPKPPAHWNCRSRIFPVPTVEPKFRARAV